MMKLVCFTALLAACFSPAPPEGSPCLSAEQCPAPLVCSSGTCVRTASDGGTDGTDPTCACAGDTLSCASGERACELGCVTDPVGAHCAGLAPSNDVGLGELDEVDDAIDIDGETIFDTDTGAITGALARPPGVGIAEGIVFGTDEFQGAPLGVFWFSALTIDTSATITFTGSRAAVFVVETSATIAGTIDGTGGQCTDVRCAGPGGGTGMPSGSGCGIGGNGATAMAADGGGGGGGGGEGGARGGTGTNGPSAGGLGGASCLDASGEPLVGGSGGGGGAPGAAMMLSSGGGGGGAFQLTALERITIAGTITMGGGGGAGGSGMLPDLNSGGGAGGGAGGTILLESLIVEMAPTTTLAANGGGGGGGGGNGVVGTPGDPGPASITPARGGQGANSGGDGGHGGAKGDAAEPGSNANNNAGGGGGGTGRIFVRTNASLPVQGIASPPVGTGSIRTR
jgi:hypothetical protein